MTAAVSEPQTGQSKGLKGGALGLWSTVVVGVASTAPAYSLAATLGFIVFFVGAAGAGRRDPGLRPDVDDLDRLLSEINKQDPDCGTSFTWATRMFGPEPAGTPAAGASSPPTS